MRALVVRVIDCKHLFLHSSVFLSFNLSWILHLATIVVHFFRSLLLKHFFKSFL